MNKTDWIGPMVVAGIITPCAVILKWSPGETFASAIGMCILFRLIFTLEVTEQRILDEIEQIQSRLLKMEVEKKKANQK